jgi:murein DD-endopeptidase MepM/ murein hydrolase activator NlpD
MSLREHDELATAQPLTRRQARELSEQQARSAKRSRGSAPRPPQAPPLAAASRTQSSRPAAKKLLSLGALLFAGALLVASTVPANAFMGNGTALAPSVSATHAPGQTVEVSADALSAAPARDGFEVISYAEQLQLLYANVSYAFEATSGTIRWPFPYAVTITDGFGPRAANVSGSAFHNGIDFTPGGGTPIYAIADGVVTAHAEDQWGFGNHVIIQHDIPDQNIESLYAHMIYGSSPLAVGDVVKVGDFIGLVGDTGNSYGAHLHFEVHVDKVPVDPFAWLTANAVN